MLSPLWHDRVVLNRSPAQLLPVFFRKRFLLLFIALLIPYILHPLSNHEFMGISLLDFSFTLVLFVGVLALSSKKHFAVTALGMVLLVQALTYTSKFFSSHFLIVTGLTLNCLYLIYTASVIFIHVITSKSVTSDTIFASLCIYLLVGLIFAFFYSLIEDLHPDAFLINRNLFAELPHGRHVFSKLYYLMYFSFTTLTTLGFGDILPASPWTRVLSSIEAIIGQLYLVVLVSRLVGLHISEAAREHPHN